MVDPVLDDEVEEARLRSVEQLQLLDSPPEDRFEQIARMARLVFDVPMSAVSLLDRDRQWFKALQGMEAQNIPRRQTICQTTIAHAYAEPDSPALIIEDASEIPEFTEIPGIGGADGVRFYAGYPLYGPGGHPVGTFCIYDQQPRRLSDSQITAFRELAAWAQREIENSNDLDRAALVQRQLLPPPLKEVAGYSITAMCVPAFAVGGDFYDHYAWRDGVIFTVADVMGKGLGAAILTSSVRSAMRAVSRALDSAQADIVLNEAVRLVADQLADDFTCTETFATLFHARLHTASGRVEYVDAGHGLAMVHRSDGAVESLPGSGLPVGVLTNDTWESHDLTLEPGDMLVIASDGLLDLLSEDSDTAAVHKLLAAGPDPESLCQAVRDLSDRRPPIDDVTVVAIRRNAAP